MRFQPKPIDQHALSRALEKAERYRLLNEPFFAESICLDILAIEPDHQEALITYILTLSDQFMSKIASYVPRAKAAVAKLRGEYERHYYAGIVCERQGYSLLMTGGPGSEAAAYEYIADAMELYDKAHAARPAGNDDAILRWNTCVRLIERHRLTPPARERYDYPLE